MNSISDSQPFVLNNLVDRIIELFSGIDNDIAMNLLHSNNDEYSKLYYRRIEILQQYPSVKNAVDGGGDISLDQEEHGVLIEYLEVKEKIDNMERMQIYFQGHADCIAYLKKIDAL